MSNIDLKQLEEELILTEEANNSLLLIENSKEEAEKLNIILLAARAYLEEHKAGSLVDIQKDQITVLKRHVEILEKYVPKKYHKLLE